MFSLKKTMAKSISSTLACAMILGTSLLPSQALTKDQLVEGVDYRIVSGTYETTTLETRKNNSDYFFINHIAPDATVVVEGETFSMVLYVANDEILAYKNELGLFERFSFKYDDEFYYGSILSSYAQETPAHKTFLKDGAVMNDVLFQLYAGQSYNCDVLTVSGIPVEALEESLLICPLVGAGFSKNAFGEDYLIDLGIDFEYEVVPSEEETQDPDPVEPTVEEKQVTITAIKSAVTAPEPDYSITIPTTVVVPDLVAGQDASISYAVTVDLGTATSVTVSSCTEGVLTSSGKAELPFTNSFTTETCTEGGLKYGEVTISKDDIATAVAGDYSGNINFAFKFTA